MTSSKENIDPLQSFTSHRKLSFSALMLGLLNLRKSAAQVELDQFSKQQKNTAIRLKS